MLTAPPSRLLVLTTRCRKKDTTLQDMYGYVDLMEALGLLHGPSGTSLTICGVLQHFGALLCNKNWLLCAWAEAELLALVFVLLLQPWCSCWKRRENSPVVHVAAAAMVLLLDAQREQSSYHHDHSLCLSMPYSYRTTPTQYSNRCYTTWYHVHIMGLGALVQCSVSDYKVDCLPDPHPNVALQCQPLR